MLARAQRPVSFSGAGLSAESGVSTFRDAQTGMWAKYDPVALASPQGFAADPAMVLEWYAHRRRGIAQAEPNAGHNALAGMDWTHITQNVDDLLHRAGAKRVLQLHGSIKIDRCHHECGFEQDVELANPPPMGSCPACSAPLRPGVVWFGEQLPIDIWSEAEAACRECDVLVVVGTSAVVYPAAGLITIARESGAKVIIINTQPSDASALADIELFGTSGTVLPKLLAAKRSD